MAQAIIYLAEQYGLEHIVISPGSRNAPMTIGFTNNDFFKCYSIVDERSAGFFALGMAQQIKRPVILVCTSGSALLNYFPAISEAFHSNIPLIVLSADRPKHLVGIGDGQTIDQKNVYGSHVIFTANLKEDISPENAEEEEPMILKSLENRLERFIGIQKNIIQQNMELIQQAFEMALNECGPVHVNVPFAEPLYETVDELAIPDTDINKAINKKEVDKTLCFDLADDWNNAERKMVIIGTNPPGEIDQKWLNTLAEDESVLVFTETNSNCQHPNFFPSIDKIIAPLEEEDFQLLKPDILLTLGGMVVSKKIKAFLRNYKPKHHWHVGQSRALDTYYILNRHIKAKANDFFQAFIPYVKPGSSSYRPYWDGVKAHRADMHQKYLKAIPFSDLKVFDSVLKHIPDHSKLHVGNSSAIRYTQLFDLNPRLEIFCNRGTSGIDGSTSTAVGASVISQKQNVFITGDLSFFYDSNALWNDYIPKSFRIILINNGGGGIFRILPGHKNTENFDTYFETVHQLNAKPLCELYGIEYFSARHQNEMDNVLTSFFEESDQPRLLEIFTPREINDSVLLEYFDFIK
ncbi:MAG: 2-succinyl-5-enolpyruvyl-6-hydroxy-3-cyclohexene-1-carboxylic-acid synthase [Flavobacteriaceae bacterium]|nr:2-succinyl-5-enolpyruvyl-6-hydroxy-3-cyclohexene-1-carboxylic-acid synthase [Flavobacteriaceae bacterium]